MNLDNKKFDLLLKLHDKDRGRLYDLQQIQILDKRGNLVPVGNLAKLTRQEGTPMIKRYDFQWAKTLTADLDERTMTSVVANKLLKTKFADLQSEYPQVSLIFGGEAESTAESMASLKDAMILALIAIFAILVFLFRSYLRPFIIMSTIPLGLFGFSLAFFFHGRPVSFPFTYWSYWSCRHYRKFRNRAH